MKELATQIAVGLAGLFVAGCGSARYGEPLTPAAPVSQEELVEGKLLFQQHCHQCHPNGESGIGPALNNKPLPRALVRMQIREGLGVMPEIPEHRLPEPEMERLIDYMVAMRSAVR